MSFAACGRDAGLKGPTGRTAQRSKPSPRFFPVSGTRLHHPRTKKEPRGRMAPGFPFDLDQTVFRRRRSLLRLALEEVRQVAVAVKITRRLR